ncbi:nucleotide exchange factor GrpE [Gordonia sp. HY442]|uniref:nucleotide exchange factor GrpE n=1 Tax=Gordonia zhenghanii TaxID=2911516 RepID=UPI001F003139|nr:nucleotide exchange factor GrpE [Gordonia zhenghanii]MCF8607781.1 nucleotide exchange factor GrpE [Gordonia zhenghanii]
MTNPETGSPEPDEVVDETVEAPAEGAFEEEPVDVEPAAEDAADSAPADAQVTELTEALQRERAQFANFRRRSAEEALQSVARGKQVLVEKLLPVLDDLDRAREHGDLEDGPLRALADKLGDVLAGEQLVKFAEPGDPFDPEIHEAIQHEGSGDTPVLGLVYRAGYRLGDKVIRTAMVTVTDPA